MERRKFLTTGAVGAAATALASPAIAQDKRQWKLVIGLAEEPARSGRRSADAGRPDHHAVGRPDRSASSLPPARLVPGHGVFDAVIEGTAELYHAVPAYWGSKSKGILLFGSQPFGLRADEQFGWLLSRRRSGAL